MSRDLGAADSSLADTLRMFRRPWPIMLAGLVCTIIGLTLSQTSLAPLRLLFLGAGLLLAGSAVACRLQTADWELDDRVRSACLLGVSFLVVLLAYQGMEESWDSGIILLRVLMIVIVAASVIVLLPRKGRRIAAVLFVVLHFCGILTAVSSVAPRNDPPSWLSMQLWNNFYRYYLFFGYFTNAYHFYSPDPGPATLLWFHIEYADGSTRWIKIPNRHESAIGLHHQRMLAAAESTMLPSGFLLETQEHIKNWEEKYNCKYEILPGIPHPSAEEIFNRRKRAALNNKVNFVDPDDIDPKTDKPRPAPLLLLDELPGVQHNEPAEMARRLIASYARHMAHTSPDPRDPGNAVASVRIYRVVHNMITPGDLVAGKHPLDDWNFSPFYMGKYDPEGNLLDPDDPYLYWHVPIIRVPRRYPEPGTYRTTSEGPLLNTHWQPAQDEPVKLINFVEIHAAQSDLIRKEMAKK